MIKVKQAREEGIAIKVLHEPGVLPRSERFFSTPSAIAQRVFLYITRCGHYYLDEQYDFRYTCDIGQEESHRNYFFAVVRSGELHVDADGDRCVARTGQCVLADCRRPHRFWCSEKTETLWMHVDGVGASAFAEEIIEKNGGRHVLSLPGMEGVERTLAELIASLRGAPLREVDHSRRLYHMLCTLLFPQLSSGEEGSAAACAMQYIAAHLHEDLPVKRVAAAVHLSASQLSRAFRAHTGFSPHEYIVLHRIDEAKALLQGTGLTVAQIADRVGYNSEVNFIASFTKKTGVSPSAFRKKTR